MSNIFDVYKDNISKYKILTREEETRLLYSAKAGNKKAFDTLVLSNQRFVIKEAKKFSNQGFDLMDLISLGNLGLIKSISRFDPKSGNKLITYSVWWIRQKIMDGISNESRLVRLPLNRGSEVQDIIKEFQKQPIGTSYLKTISKVCDMYNLTEYELVERVNLYYMTNPKFRDKILLGPENLLAEDFLESRLSLDTKRILKNRIDLLKDREVYIATKYFDLFGYSRTLESIGEELGLTRERVRQIKVKIVNNLSGCIEKSDFNNTIYIPYSLLNIKEDSYTKEISILYELSDFVNEDYRLIDNLDHTEAAIDEELDLDDDIMMELYETL